MSFIASYGERISSRTRYAYFNAVLSIQHACQSLDKTDLTFDERKKEQKKFALHRFFSE